MYGAKFMMEKLIIAYIVYTFGYSLMEILISGVGSKFTMETFLSLAVRDKTASYNGQTGNHTHLSNVLMHNWNSRYDPCI